MEVLQWSCPIWAGCILFTITHVFWRRNINPYEKLNKTKRLDSGSTPAPTLRWITNNSPRYRDSLVSDSFRVHIRSRTLLQGLRKGNAQLPSQHGYVADGPHKPLKAQCIQSTAFNLDFSFFSAGDAGKPAVDNFRNGEQTLTDQHLCQKPTASYSVIFNLTTPFGIDKPTQTGRIRQYRRVVQLDIVSPEAWG